MSSPLLTSLVTLVALFACFSAFLSERAPRALVRPAPATNTTVPSVLPPVNLTASCLSSCGPGGTCNQSQATGIVFRCLSCPSPLVSVQTACVLDPCASVPWCSTAAAVKAVAVHNALVLAAVHFYNGSVTGLYPTGGPIQLSANWTRTLAPVFTTQADAITLLNTFLEAKFALVSQGSSASALPWLDDQRGFWNSSLVAYSPPVEYSQYLLWLKSRICLQRWRVDRQTGECLVP